MIGGLLLAGGAAQRFGGPKLLALLPSGQSVAQSAAHHLVLALGPVLAVVRPGDDVLAAQLRGAGCEILCTARCTEGLGASLAAGVEARPTCDAWIVALADMPWIDPATIREVAGALRAGARLAAPVLALGGRRGHPVGFAGTLGPELRALAGDEGARGVIERHRGHLIEVHVPDRGIHRDVDVPGDLPRDRT